MDTPVTLIGSRSLCNDPACGNPATVLLDDGDDSDTGDLGTAALCARHAERAWADPLTRWRNWSTLLAAAAILAATSLSAAQATAPIASAKPAHARVRPARSITIKAMPPAHYAKRAATADPTFVRTKGGRLIPTPWLLTSVDADSCVAWIKAEAPAPDGDPLSGDAAAELGAYKACKVAMASFATAK